ncbi:MAG: LPS export ABC transporter periplasmic protein LptC [Alphaproteobacteria bacterium]|nr:LPS export ABC transporter periplasmic protein LptC [Alphaproteobacteria bacterium]
MRVTRIALPALALALLATLVLWNQGKTPYSPPPVAEVLPADKAWDNTLFDPRYESRDAKGRPYVVTADRALQDAGKDAPVLLEAPQARLTLPDGREVTAAASLGRYDASSETLDLLQGVTLYLDDHALQTSVLTLDLVTQAAHGAEPVDVAGPTLTLTATGLDGVLGTEVLTFAGPGRLLLTPKDGAHVVVTAKDSISWNRKEQRFVATGDATAAQDKARVAANVLEALYESKQGKGLVLMALEARGLVVATFGDAQAQGAAGHYNVRSGRARMSGPGLRAIFPEGQTLTARDAFAYDTQRGVFVAEGQARLTHTADSWVTAPRMTAHLAPDAGGKMAIRTLEAEGGVVAVQGGARVTGPRARVDPVTGTATILGGRTRAVLYPEEEALTPPR